MPTKIELGVQVQYNFTCKDCDLTSLEYQPLPEVVFTLSIHLQIHHKMPYPSSLDTAKRLILEQVNGGSKLAIDEVLKKL